MWNNSAQNLEDAKYTYSDRGNSDNLNCYPLPPPSRWLTYRNVDNTDTIAPFVNQGNRRLCFKPFLLNFKTCNVHAFPIYLQVNTIAWNRIYFPGTTSMLTDFTDAMYESTYAVQQRTAPTQNSTPPISVANLPDMLIHTAQPRMEGYHNDSSALEYHMQQGSPDWHSANMKNRFKLLVRRKGVLVPPGGMYTFKLKFRPPRTMKFEEFANADSYKMILQRLLMITFKSECGVRAASDVANASNQYANVTLSDPLVVPLIATGTVQGKIQYYWPKVHIFQQDDDLQNVVQGSVGQQVHMNSSAQAVNLQP